MGILGTLCIWHYFFFSYVTLPSYQALEVPGYGLHIVVHA